MFRLRNSSFRCLRPNSEIVSEFELSTFADRVNELIGGKRRRNAFARECGLSETSVRQYQEGAIPGLDKVIQIARAKNVSVNWLATGEGPRSAQPQGALDPSGTDQEQKAANTMLPVENTSEGSRIRFLPQLTVEASAGTGLIPLSEEVAGFVALNEDYLREMGVDPRHAHVLRVSGRSMAPTINDKDIVVVDTSVRTPTSEGIFTLVYGETVLIKRIRLQRDGGITLVSDNKSEGYTDEVVPRSELSTLHIVGRVKTHIRSL